MPEIPDLKLKTTLVVVVFPLHEGKPKTFCSISAETRDEAMLLARIKAHEAQHEAGDRAIGICDVVEWW